MRGVSHHARQDRLKLGEEIPSVPLRNRSPEVTGFSLPLVWSSRKKEHWPLRHGLSPDLHASNGKLRGAFPETVEAILLGPID